MNFTIEIPGPPVAKERPRFARKGSFVTAYKTKKQAGAEDVFITRALEAVANLEPKTSCELPFKADTPLSLSMDFVMPWPKGTPKTKREEGKTRTIPHIKKSDLDNLVKFVLDCMNGVLWEDDRTIWSLRVSKYYGEEPKTIIFVIDQ